MIARLVVGAVVVVIGSVVVVGVWIWVICLMVRFSGWFRIQCRRLRFRAAVLLGRPVPADGLPLDPDEAHAFIDAVRGWDLPAFEPAREAWRQQ